MRPLMSSLTRHATFDVLTTSVWLVKPNIRGMILDKPQKVDVTFDVITDQNDAVFEAKHLRHGFRWGGHDF